MAYSEQDKQNALELYRINGRNTAAVAKTLNVSRGAVTQWKHKGEPIRVTGGTPWDDYLDNTQMIQQLHAGDVVGAALSTDDFLVASRAKLQTIIERVYKDIMGGHIKPRASDMAKFIDLSLQLSSEKEQAAKQMRNFALALLEIVDGVVSRDQFVKIQSRFAARFDDAKAKIGVIEASDKKPLNLDDGVIYEYDNSSVSDD